MSFKITNKSDILKQIKQIDINETLKIILPNILHNIKPRVIETFLYYFGHHPVIQSLLGFNAGDEDKDLPAIFGLKEQWSHQFSEDLLNLIKDSLRIDLQNRTALGQFAKRNTFTLIIYTDDFTEQVLKLESGKYNYTSKKYGIQQINWIDWLINGIRTQASISFDLSDSQIKASRSHRAIMINDGFGWEFNREEFNENGEQNFIEDVLKDRQLRSDVEKIYKEELELGIIRYI